MPRVHLLDAADDATDMRQELYSEFAVHGHDYRICSPSEAIFQAEQMTSVPAARSDGDYSSLMSIPGSFSLVNAALQLPFVDFPQHVWALPAANEAPMSVCMNSIIKYALIAFHMLCHHPSTDNFTASAFFSIVAPALDAFGSVSGLFQLDWVNGVGFARATSGPMETVFLPTAGGSPFLVQVQRAERVLRRSMAAYEFGSASRFMQLKKFILQWRDADLSLHALHVRDAHSSDLDKCYTCQVPCAWDQCFNMFSVFGLLATLLLGLQENSETEELHAREAAGLDHFDGATVQIAFLDRSASPAPFGSPVVPHD
ncbi:hypothetical protein BC940DRAFT_318390 [Gongronella butleri]|nr:hypothetical protein BC940DRAFT_318390 [Gongronella butleri]